MLKVIYVIVYLLPTWDFTGRHEDCEGSFSPYICGQLLLPPGKVDASFVSAVT